MRKDAQDLPDLDVDRVALPAVSQSSPDETVDPLRSNADGEHDVADGGESMEVRKEPSVRKIEANRKNARHSTGPRTAAGKQAVKGNALKHGLLSREVVISA